MKPSYLCKLVPREKIGSGKTGRTTFFEGKHPDYTISLSFFILESVASFDF